MTPVLLCRYVRVQDAVLAAKEMHNVRVYGKLLTTEYLKPVTYFSQDETTLSPNFTGFC